MARRKVFLAPGFFGFTSIGSLNYFNGVAEVLSDRLKDHGVRDMDVIECATQPTGSIRNRADRLLETVIEQGGHEADELHYVGHSTGGLDIRLLTTPGVRLRPGDDEEELGTRTRSVTTVSTPHYGTPLSSFFTSLQGRNLLRLLAVLATSNQGRHSIFLAAQLTSAVARLDDKLGRRDTMLDLLAERLLDQLTLKKDDPLWDFLDEVSSDQGAIIQLTPEGMNLFNAAVIDRPEAKYGCVVAAAPPPAFKRLGEMGSIERMTGYAIFTVLHTLTSREHRHYPYPSPPALAWQEISDKLPLTVSSGTNDGVVPTLSQVHGDVISAVVADHLDVVGQFRGSGGLPYADWLPSGSRFNNPAFEQIWDSVAQVIASAGG
jgi:hypothetical protein